MFLAIFVLVISKVMKIVSLKLVVCGAFSSGFYFLAQFLIIPPLLPTGLAAWGAVCFLFSQEFSGTKVRIRNGIEEKQALQIMWMVAGLLCVLLAVGVLFFQA